MFNLMYYLIYELNKGYNITNKHLIFFYGRSDYRNRFAEHPNRHLMTKTPINKDDTFTQCTYFEPKT